MAILDLTGLRRWQAVCVVALGALLSACGGGGGSAGTPSLGGGGASTNAAASVDVSLSASTLSDAVGSSITVTAVVKDANNVALPNTPLTWATSAGTLSGISTTTGAGGVATATFTANDRSAGSATITVTAGSAKGSSVVTLVAGSVSIELLASELSVGTGGEQVTIRAFIKDGSNVAKAKAPVIWSVDNGRISAQQNETDANGVATAQLDAGADKTNRTAVVTVASGSVRRTLSVPIVNTRITVSGPNSGRVGSSIPLTFSAVDSKGTAIPNATLSLNSALGNGVPATVRTDLSGQVVVSLAANRSGADTITATGLGASQAVPVTITGVEDELAFVSPSPSLAVPVGATQTVTIQYLKAGVAQVGTAINVAATIGSLGGVSEAGNVTTDAGGRASFTVSSRFAGSSTVTIAVGSSTVRATLPINFVATVPARLVLQAGPTALPPNPVGTSNNQATVLAKVSDANGNPVANQTVNFTQAADPSGGRLQQASAVTDSNGVATVQYLSGAQSTASGAVILSAFVPALPSVSGQTSLTVNQSALFVTLGTGNTITNVDPQTYDKRWTVYVTDSTGVRVTNVPVTLKAIPLEYGKGCLVFEGTAGPWVYSTAGCLPGAPPAPLFCANEDGPDNPGFPSASKPAGTTFNGFLDAGEDFNLDGRLTPGNVVFLNSSTVTTDANGTATFSLRYAESYAPWVRVRITASAVVGGTESTATFDLTLPGSADDFTDKGNPPAGVRSPFGIDTSSCANAR